LVLLKQEKPLETNRLRQFIFRMREFEQMEILCDGANGAL
jgi:hypothetical protein